MPSPARDGKENRSTNAGKMFDEIWRTVVAAGAPKIIAVAI